MIKDTVSVDEIIDFLNELLVLDRDAIQELTVTHVPCNEYLATHATVQVQICVNENNKYWVGMLGILNGLFGIRDDGYGQIVAVFDNGSLIRFEKNC